MRKRPPASPCRRLRPACIRAAFIAAALAVGCASEGETTGDGGSATASHGHWAPWTWGHPAATPTPAAVPVAPQETVETAQVPPREPTMDDLRVPDDHAWARLSHIRGQNWPLVRNEGICRQYDVEKGEASYYHDPQRLATGERFNPDAMTAAHKTLPFGTIVRCTRTDTGKSVVVVINDRGPFVNGRIIDLSRGAARAIDQIEDGVVPCTVEVLAYPMIEAMGPNGNG